MMAAEEPVISSMPSSDLPLPIALYQLASHYLSVANAYKNTLSTDPSATTPILQYATSAIGCLEAALNAGNDLEPSIEVAIRLMLAKTLMEYTENLNVVDAHLQKALILSRRIPDHDYKYSVIDIQIDHLMQLEKHRQVLHLLKSTIAETNQLGSAIWCYRFTLRMAQIHEDLNESLACRQALKTLIQMAKERSDATMHVVLLLMKAQHSLRFKDVKVAEDTLNVVSDLFRASQATDTMPDSSVNSGYVIATSSFFIRVYYAILRILPLIGVKCKDAKERLKMLFELVESRKEFDDWDPVTGIGKIKIKRSQNPLLPPLQSASLEEEIGIQWLKKNEIYSIVYLISGLVYKLDSNDKEQKSKRFLEKGLDFVIGLFVYVLCDSGLTQSVNSTDLTNNNREFARC